MKIRHFLPETEVAPKELPIGIFDSGVGGLTVLRELRRVLPGEKYIYYADTAHVPYGDKPPDIIKGYAEGIIRFFATLPVKGVIMGCNISSAVALDWARRRYGFFVEGLIEPSVVAAVRLSRSGRIGVLCTQATHLTGAHARAARRSDPRACVVTIPAPRLVPLVEAGRLTGPDAQAAVREVTTPLKEAGVDTLIFGCSHYPFLAPLVSQAMGKKVRLVDPAQVVAKRVAKMLKALGLVAEGPGFVRCLASGSPRSLHEVGSRFLGEPIESVELLPLATSSPAAAEEIPA